MDENESQDPLLEFTQYRRTVKGVPMIFTVRDPSSKEDLEYRRRTQKMNYRNGKVEASDTSLDAHEWLIASWRSPKTKYHAKCHTEHSKL
jgi:hypothetical protein